LADDSGLPDLEEFLPADRFDILARSMVPERSPLHATMSESGAYAYFEEGRYRFGWFRDPSGLVGEVGDVFAPRGRLMTGDVYWSVLLRRRQAGWRVEKALRWGSLVAARLASGMEWAGRRGYLVNIQGNRYVVGPAIDDLADPARYLELMRETRHHRRIDS
jgi:hypothetical protein